MPKEKQGERRISTGTSGLDEMLHGGVPEGNCFILQGPPGNEKDLIANQYVKQGLLNGEIVFVILSTISPEEFRKQLKFIGINPKKYEASGDLMIVDWYSYKHERVKSVEEGSGEEKAVIKASFDLTNVGIAITKTIEGMDKKKPKRAVINLLSSALTSFGLKTVYNFAQATRAKCRQENITTIFVLDSEAQDMKVLSTFHQIFDGLIEVSRTRTGPTLKREICILSMSGTSIDSEYKELSVDVNAISVRGVGAKAAAPKEEGPAGTSSPVSSLDDIFKGFMEAEQRAESERASLAQARADTGDINTKSGNAEAQIRAGAKPAEEDVLEEITVIVCPECNYEIPGDALQCPKCGVEFEPEKEEEAFHCPQCSWPVGVTDMKCPHCGVVFDEEEEEEEEGAEIYDEEPEMELGSGVDEAPAVNPKDELRTMLKPWQSEAYKLDYFNGMIESDPTAARKEIMIFVSRARELQLLEKRIKVIGATKLEKALNDLKRDVSSPDKSKRGGIEWSILELRGRVKQVAKAKGDEAKDKKFVIKKRKKA